MDARFPFPEFPTGWFAAGFGTELTAGRLLSRTWMGQEIVLFRDSSGAVAALGAHCPHLGAHLGKGGLVEAGKLRCPFHAFGFDGEGRCVSTPYGGRVPPLRTRTWPVVERNGVILLWHDPGEREPAWTIPGEPASREWGALSTRTYRVRTHPQETTENSIDFGHLGELHGDRKSVV